MTDSETESQLQSLRKKVKALTVALEEQDKCIEQIAINLDLDSQLHHQHVRKIEELLTRVIRLEVALQAREERAIPYMPGPPGPRFAPFTVTCNDTVGPAL